VTLNFIVKLIPDLMSDSVSFFFLSAVIASISDVIVDIGAAVRIEPGAL
jgi:hypothetical protein